MALYTRCHSCGFCIGLYEEVFDLIKETIYKDILKDKKIHPDRMYFCANIVPDMSEVFEALNIKNRCCRKILSTKYTAEMMNSTSNI